MIFLLVNTGFLIGQEECFCFEGGEIGFPDAPLETTNVTDVEEFDEFEDNYVQDLCIKIYGTLRVNTDFTFDNCTFLMTPGSRILVRQQRRLNIYKSTLRGCETMWQGIHLEQGSQTELDFQGNTIKDAQFAILWRDRNGMIVHDNTFLSNYIAVFSPEKPGFSYNDLAGLSPYTDQKTFRDNHFGNDPFLYKEPYEGQTPHPGNMPFAGMYFTDSKIKISNGNNVTNFENSFGGLRRGIVFDKCRQSAIHDASFVGIVETEGDPLSGSAVVIIEGSDFIEVTDNFMFKIKTGVYIVEGHDHLIENNEIKSGGTGIFATNSSGDLEIIDNKITSGKNGIFVGSSNVDDDLIEIKENVVTPFTSGITANFVEGKLNILDNIINYEHEEENMQRTGINASFISGPAKIRGNLVHAGEEFVHVNQGILLSFCENAQVAENQILGTDNPEDYWGYGINLDQFKPYG